jgi:hypothetical protein
VKTIFFTIVLGLSTLVARAFTASLTSQDTLFQTKDVVLMLWNPGTLLHGYFYVPGSLYLFNDHFLFKTHDESAFVKKITKNHYQYNFLINDLSISYSEIKKVKRRFFLMVKSEGGNKIKVGMRAKECKKVVVLLNGKIKAS